MENNNVNDSNHKSLVNELVEGKDLTKKLQLILGTEQFTSSNEALGMIAQSILAKFERSLQILHHSSMSNQSSQIQKETIGKIDSPKSYNKSPKSPDSDEDFKDLAESKDNSKKRRNAPHSTYRVQGSTSSGLEGPIEDGYNWRKYGQKDIFGANYPRAYYRCIYKSLHGCSATKQVQRSDDDPSFFLVTYRGKHTCSQAPPSPSPNPNNPTLKLEPQIETLAYAHSQQPQNIMWDFQKDHNVQDIKPIINNHCESMTKLPSSSNSWVDHHQELPNTMLNCKDKVVDDASFSTNRKQSPIRFLDSNKNFAIDHYSQGVQGIIQPSSSTYATNMLIESGELSFDHQGEFDTAFVFNNPQFFQ